ncbi:MAG TPA: HAD family hydrolase [Candidatus Limnocylindrales bacterium]|nr:HAD family hydrolase [Candidatus Limnocylindrales bacterium]
MIKAIITDVDGVIVGKKKGVNYPLPNKLIIGTLKKLHKKGFPIILCTAKFSYAIHEIIKQADLRNPHITDGGALTIDLLSNKIIAVHTLENQLALQIISDLLKSGIYTECYGVSDYFIQENQKNKFTEKRSELLQKTPTILSSLMKEVPKIDVIKIIAFQESTEEKQRIEIVLEKFDGRINFIWSTHPALFPNKPTVITVKGISKKSASFEVLKNLGIKPDETLGIGDSLADWNFMEICKYAGTVGNESRELKELVKKKGAGNYFHGSSVDENGFIDILNFFKL